MAEVEVFSRVSEQGFMYSEVILQTAPPWMQHELRSVNRVHAASMGGAELHWLGEDVSRIGLSVT